MTQAIRYSDDLDSIVTAAAMTNAIAPPTWIEGSNQALYLESTLAELPLYQFQIEIDRLGSELAHLFEQHPLLAGAVLTEQGRYVGMISRQRLLEFLLRPHGLELFLSQPLRTLYSYARTDILRLPGSTQILAAAQQTLRRSPELIGEPIVVSNAETHALLDVHSLNIAYWQIRGIETQVRYERTQAEMIQSDKKASLGRLVDGVAHEILDPISFIWGNLSHVTAYSDSLLKLMVAYDRAFPEPPVELLDLREELEIDYLQEDFPQAIASIRTGADRLTKLATSLQTFCHIDEVSPKPADLHELLNSILLLLKSRLSSDIQVVRHYGHLPPVPCFAGQLNQVFMNILSNAVDSLITQAVSQQLDLNFNADRRSLLPSVPFKPTITITTQVLSRPTEPVDRWVSIAIADNSAGLSLEAQKQLLQSFTVERRATKETSLAVSYQIVTAKHGGKFEVRSRSVLPNLPLESDRAPEASQDLDRTAEIGTEFLILLPLT